MGLRMKNFNIFEIQEKIRFLGGIHEKPMYRGGLPKRGELGQFADLRGGGDFEGG